MDMKSKREGETMITALEKEKENSGIPIKMNFKPQKNKRERL